MVVIDIESYDPNLKELGNGSIRKDFQILCVGVYRIETDTFKWYGPKDQELIDILASDEPKILHNAGYDLSLLCVGHGYKLNGIVHDTMTREALINEYSSLSLEACCKNHKIAGKNFDETLGSWWKQHGSSGSVWDNILYIWNDFYGRQKVIEYNEQDCRATATLFIAQEPYIALVQDTYNIECGLWPIILEMKRNGILIDEVSLDALSSKVTKELEEVEKALYMSYNIDRAIIASPKKLGEALSNLGLTSPIKTPKGKPSWSADALVRIHHPAITMIQAIKAKTSLLNKYLHGSLRKAIVNGRIHGDFTPNKRTEGGTVTGRFASSNPNMQNIPAREFKNGQPTYGPAMRSLFLPEEGCLIGALDYSQIEYLLLAHFAQGKQAQWFKEMAKSGVDFHSLAMEATGIEKRSIIKTINYGVIYGMGVNTMLNKNYNLFEKNASELNTTPITYTQDMFNQYHKRLPVIKDTMNYVQRVVRTQGYIEGIGGRRHHKPKATYVNGQLNNKLYIMPNHLIQGSAAEILKKGLVNAWEAGIFKVLMAHLTVHDENVVSIPKTKTGVEATKELQICMEGAYKEKLEVPMKVDMELGENWGTCTEKTWKELQNVSH